MSRIEKWSVRTLRDKIDSMLCERTAISKKPDALIKKELKALRDSDVAEYLTDLPGKKLLQQKLHKTLELAKERLEKKE